MKKEFREIVYEHKSVLVDEVIENLSLKPNGIYIDATFGGGGHSRAILEAEPTCSVFAIDWDAEAIEHNASSLECEFGDRFKIIWGNFANIYTLLKKEHLPHIDGILADFGTSQYQITHKAGFSFFVDTPLDMRMSPAHQKLTAEFILNEFSEQEIAKILFEFGEEPQARTIATTIVTKRKTTPFKTTSQLANLIEALFPRHHSKNPKIHPATQTFQALRIYINKEFDNIHIFLTSAIPLLSPGGRLVCISFHSLEDRLVKNVLKELEHQITPINTKPIVAGNKELERNPSARSAKMRVAEKI